jgi:hypothetical protein
MDEQKSTNQEKAREGTIWVPDARQVSLVELLINPDDRRSKTEKCEAAGVPRRTFYNWMAEENFVNYYYSQLDRYTSGELPEIWKAHLRQAKAGNVPAIELYYKMKGLHPDIKLKKESLEKGEGVIHELLTAIAEAANGN